MLQLKDVTKTYGPRTVVDCINLTVGRGEAFGLLGPNGAGKSTTISLISGLLQLDKGEITVDGHSIHDDPVAVKRSIGVVPQEIALYETMTAAENLLFWGEMYGVPKKQLKEKVAEVLEFIGLTDRAHDQVGTFSGGMKRRVNIGAALLHEPKVLIMDEPTVGIDPQSRNHILQAVKTLNEQGMTIIYTSHYMEEVDYLCDRLAIIDHGKVIALGNKEELVRRIGSDTTIVLTVQPQQKAFVAELRQLKSVTTVQESEDEIRITTGQPNECMNELVIKLPQHGVKLLSLHVNEPNLEALFLQLTGRKLRD